MEGLGEDGYNLRKVFFDFVSDPCDYLLDDVVDVAGSSTGGWDFFFWLRGLSLMFFKPRVLLGLGLRRWGVLELVWVLAGVSSLNFSGGSFVFYSQVLGASSVGYGVGVSAFGAAELVGAGLEVVFPSTSPTLQGLKAVSLGVVIRAALHTDGDLGLVLSFYSDFVVK